MPLRIRSAGPHQAQPVREAGAPLPQAQAAVILLHGRGATAEDILGLSEGNTDERIAWLAPQAAGQTWYPNRFIAPIASNEPWLTSALDAVGDLVAQAMDAGIPRERMLLAGFSQGGCLALEFLVRFPAKYGAAAGLSGGLIGPPGTVWPTRGSLHGTPVFLGCSDVDFHIPKERVLESADVLRAQGANVEAILYPNMDHVINKDELTRFRRLVAGLTAQA
jgi:phospholipase/carboxylesterase